MRNNCENCKHQFCVKSEISPNRAFVLCEIKGSFDNTTKCDKYEELKGDVPLIEKENLSKQQRAFFEVNELMWRMDAMLNMFNPDYGRLKEAENEYSERQGQD